MRSTSLLVALVAALAIAGTAAPSALAAAPTCGGFSVSSTYEDTPVPATLSCSDADTPSADLRYTVETAPAHGALSLSVSGGMTVYKPAAGYTGSDTFTVRASDGTSTSAGVFTVNVTVAAHTALSACSASWTRPTRAGAAEILAIDGFTYCTGSRGLPREVAIITPPAHGTLIGPATNPLYVPADGFTGPDEFVYKVRNALGESGPLTGRVDVTKGYNQLPQCSGPTPVLNVRNTGAPITIPLSCRDEDLDKGAFAISTAPTHGSLSAITPGSFQPIANNVMPTLGTTKASVVYTPTPGYYGDDSLAFRVDDGRELSAPITVTVHLVDPAINTAPTCFASGGLAPSGGAGALLIGCSDAEGDPVTVSVSQAPDHGAISGLSGLLTSPQRSYRYEADAAFTGLDSFALQASDGTSTSPVMNLTETVVDPSFLPTGITQICNPVLNVTRNQTLVSDDPYCMSFDGSMTTAAVTQAPSHGTASFDASGHLTYVPEQNFVGGDQFTLRTSGPNAPQSFTVLVGVNSNAKAKILSGPAANSQTTSQSFTFSVEPGVTTTCSLSNSTHVSPTACTDGIEYTGTPAGEHVFTVTATDDAGRVSTDTYAFRVEAPPTPGGGGSSSPPGGGASSTGAPSMSPTPSAPSAPTPPAATTDAAPALPVRTPTAPSAAPTRAEIVDALADTLGGRLPSTRTLRKKGVRVAFDAPAAGRITIRWYATVNGRRVLIARGTQVVSTGDATVALRLTKAGRKLLRGRASDLSVTAKATFTRHGRRGGVTKTMHVTIHQ